MSVLPEWCPPYSSRKVDPLTNEEVYCICKKPDSGELMVGCDGCNDWFHFKCLKLPIQYRDLVYSFFCPYCQAGVTGPSSQGRGELPQTLWKRKCRVANCFQPCQERSKYCSKEHARDFLNGLVTHVHVDDPKIMEMGNREFILRMIQYSQDGELRQFTGFGDEGFIKRPIPDGLSEYDKSMQSDERLKQLNNDMEEMIHSTIPDTIAKQNVLESFWQRIKDINAKLNAKDGPEGPAQQINAETSSKKKSNKRTRQKGKQVASRNICGYTSDLANVPDAEQFIKQYHENTDSKTINGICTRIKCSKHGDWYNMLIGEYRHDLDSLHIHKDRLTLLINLRKQQLHIQFYETLLKKKANLSTT